MFQAIWTALVLVNGVPQGIATVAEPPVKSRAACEASVREHAARAPDWIRGAIRAGWHADIKVKGSCQPVTDPA